MTSFPFWACAMNGVTPADAAALAAALARKSRRLWTLRAMSPRSRGILPLPTLVPRQHQHLGLARQCRLRHHGHRLRRRLDGEVVTDAVEETVEREGIEVVHGQDQAST